MRDPGDECTCDACSGRLDPFIEKLLALICAEIPNPGVAAAREEFVVAKPEGWSDAEWEQWVTDMSRAYPDRARAGAAAISHVGI
jgi:hypothetical protein